MFANAVERQGGHRANESVAEITTAGNQPGGKAAEGGGARGECRRQSPFGDFELSDVGRDDGYRNGADLGEVYVFPEAAQGAGADLKVDSLT